MKHLFKTKAHDLAGIYKDVYTMSRFKNNLEKQSKLDPDRYDTLKYLGDGFEFFCELFLSLHPVDNRIGIANYEPTQENDNGVDGVGINMAGEKCVVQIKYKSDATSHLTANRDHLSNMFSDGQLSHNVMVDTENKRNYRHFVLTTSSGLHFYTDQEMYKGSVMCLGYKQFRRLVDNNVPFWDAAREIVNGLQ